MMERWPTKKLGEVCDVFTDGDWIESKDQSPEGVRLIQTGNVGSGQFKDRAEKARYISEATFKRLRCTEIFHGDCLISRLPEPVGRSCILPDTGERMITAVDCTIVRFDRQQVRPEFFNLYSQSNEYLRAVAKECTGTTRSRISRSNLALTPIPVPPLAEQRRIVDLLEDVLAGIATAKTNAERNLQNAHAVFERDLSLVFSQTGEGWTTSTIGEICALKSGTTLPPAVERPVGDVPYLKVADMTVDGNEDAITTSSRFLMKVDVNESQVIPKGATIFPKRGGAILTNKKRMTRVPILADLNIMAVIPSSRIHPELVYFYFLNVDMRELGTGSSIPQINNYDIAPLVIAFPEAASEQREVCLRLRALHTESLRLASIYARKLALLDELKTSLLHQAFSGNL